MLTKPTTLYEALEITADASPHEVRDAYLRLKSAYNKDSVALYTLISTEEREEILERVEEAYQTLSDPDRRKQYDRFHGEISYGNERDDHHQIVSIDRVPPMESGTGFGLSEAEELLVPPSTDFADALEPTRSMPAAAPTPAAVAPNPRPTHNGHASETDRAAEKAIEEAILGQVEWRGDFIRKVREARKLSIAELANTTKISKTYLTAIESEDYGKLPAAVFTRGFLIQIARILRLPKDSLIGAYMPRFTQARAVSEQAR